MNDNLFSFTQSLAFENNLDTETATRLTTWLTNEGVLNTDIIRDTYTEQHPQYINDNDQAVGG